MTSNINSKVPQQQQLSQHRNSISNLHSGFDISSRRSRQYIYIDVRERRPLRPRRACCSAALLHYFAGATLLNLCLVEHVAPRHARITLWALRLRNSTAQSAIAPRHPTSLCNATPTKLRRAERVRSAAPRIALLLLRLRNTAAPSAFRRRSAASPHWHYFAGATPTTLRRLRCAEDATLGPGRIWPRPLRPRTPAHYIDTHSFDLTHKFEFHRHGDFNFSSRFPGR